MGFVYITWAGEKKEWSTQLLRPGYYGQRRAGGWRIPTDDEDLTLETRANAIDAPSDDGESGGKGESGGVSSSELPSAVRALAEPSTGAAASTAIASASASPTMLAAASTPSRSSGDLGPVGKWVSEARM